MVGRGIVARFKTGVKDLSLLQSGQSGSGPHLVSYCVGAEDSHPGVKVTGAGSRPLISPIVELYLHLFLHGMHKGNLIAHLHRLIHAKCINRSTQQNYRDKRIIDYRSRSLVLLVHCFSPTVTFRAACYRGGFA